MTFSVSATLETQVSQSSLRETRDTIESELGNIQVGVDGGSVSSQLNRTIPDGGAAAAGGSIIADKLDEQTDLLAEIKDTIEQSAVSAGGGGGGGVLGGLLPSGGQGGGGGGFLGGLLTGGLALKAKNVLSVGGVLSLAAPQVLAVGGVLTLTAAGVLAVQGRFEQPARELLAVGGVLSIGAAGVLAVTGALSLPAAAVIGVAGAITLGVSEIVRLLPEGPSNVKTDGVRDSTKPGATDKTRVEDIGSFIGNSGPSPSGVTDFLEDAQQGPPVQGPGVDLNRAALRQSQPIQVDVSQRIDIEDSRQLEQRLEKLKRELKREIERELNTDATL